MFPSQCLHSPWLWLERVWPGAIWPQAVSWAQVFSFKPVTSLQQVPSSVHKGLFWASFFSPGVLLLCATWKCPSVITGPWACLSHPMRLFRGFMLERVMLLMECPNLAYPRCAEFSGLVSQATEGRQNSITCFGRWLAAPAVCLVGQGLTNGCKLQSNVGPGGGWLRMVALLPQRLQKGSFSSF